MKTMPRRKTPVNSEFNRKTSKFFKEKRIAMGVSQPQLAEIFYGSKTRSNTISDIENNMKPINYSDIDKYCEYFNCEVVFKENTVQ